MFNKLKTKLEKHPDAAAVVAAGSALAIIAGVIVFKVRFPSELTAEIRRLNITAAANEIYVKNGAEGISLLAWNVTDL